MNYWIKSIAESYISNASGQFSTNDSFNNEIIIEWEKVDPRSAQLSKKISDLCQPLVHAYTQVELEFARKYPEAVPNEMFLKPLAPMFQQGVEQVDWNIAHEQLSTMLTQFFTKTDWSLYSGANDINFFAVAKEKESGKQLRMIQLIITDEFSDGDVKVALYDGVVPMEQQRGLEKLLISVVFRLMPAAKRIFFHTRITNEKGIQAHQALEFTEFPSDLANWINLEYKAEKSSILQNTALTY